MNKYYLITEHKSGGILWKSHPIKIDVLETKKSCEETMVKRENEGFQIIRVVKGKELEFKCKKVEIVTEFELDETTHLGPPYTAPKITVRQYD